jgi:hypothetical protein
LLGGAAALLLAAASAVAPVAPAVLAGSPGNSGQVALAGTGGPQVGDFTPSGTDELQPPSGEEDEATDAYNGVIDRSLSNGHVAHGVAVNAGKKAKSNPTFVSGFEGLNHYQQRYSRGGNQFSVEPPDQGLCVGNGFVVEVVNDVFNVYNQSGQSVLPDNTATNIVSLFPRNVNHAVDLNSFYGYPPALDRAHGNVRGEFVTDPSCLYDVATQRFFLVSLTLDPQVSGPCQGVFSCVNHLDLAVSQTSNPTGQWNIYKIDVTNDGTNTGGVNGGPYLGDYPHMGADANAIYLTTNSYPWHHNGFSGAQIYALSKSALAAGSASVPMVHFDTSGMVNAPSDAGTTQPGFTVWPAQSPGTNSFEKSNGGTEYFLSSNAADESQNPKSGAAGSRTSTQIVVWTLTNTASIDKATPSLGLSDTLVTVGQYGVPPRQRQPGAGTAPSTDTPAGHCLNDETTSTIAGVGCWKLLVGSGVHALFGDTEVISSPDANDTRMQQVMFANGKLWGALDTAVTVNGANQAGIAWYIVNPSAGTLSMQGYLADGGMDFAYPAIGITASGRGVIAFTATGGDTYPSAAYASIDSSVGVTSWNIVTGGTGAATDDGFSGYKQLSFPNPVRTRWGDYGAAAVDGNSVWIASEYIATACGYTTWGGPFFVGGAGDNLLGTCAGASHGPGGRTALANWSTRISQFAP